MSSCFSAREKGRLSEYQKWDYITLSDFTLSSTTTLLSYIWLWFLALIAVAVFAADTYTAIILLVYDRWSSQIKPSIPFYISKWIFAACILFSWVLAVFEFIRAFRIMRRGSVAESYLNPLAATLESIRINGKATGWRRFLVFAALTKSRKGADYVALFVYFQFQAAVRIILAQGPRQVVNALTLYSVMQANLIPTGSNAATGGHSSFEQFFINVKILAGKQEEQAVILFTMLFTLVIWVISALSFLAAILLYGGFLWHYIPKSDGSLSNYCRRKIDRRLEKIVSAQVKTALEKQEARQRRENERAKKRGHQVEEPRRNPTLPAITDKEDDLLDNKLPLVRQASQATLPIRAPTRQGSDDTTGRHLMYREDSSRRPRTPSPGSSFANSEYDEDGPLILNASSMHGSQKRLPPRPDYHRADSSSASSVRQAPGRTMTGSTNSSHRRFPIRTPPPAQQQQPAIPLRTLTAQSQRSVSAPTERQQYGYTGYEDGGIAMPDLPGHYRNPSVVPAAGPTQMQSHYPGAAWHTEPISVEDVNSAHMVEMPYQAYAPETYQPLGSGQYQQGQQPTSYSYANTYTTTQQEQQQQQRSQTPFTAVPQSHEYDTTFRQHNNGGVEAEAPSPPPKTTVYHYPDPLNPPRRAMTTSHSGPDLAEARRVIAPPRRVATAPIPKTARSRDTFRGYEGQMGGGERGGHAYGYNSRRGGGGGADDEYGYGYAEQGQRYDGYGGYGDGYDVYDSRGHDDVKGFSKDRLGRLVRSRDADGGEGRERQRERERERGWY